MTHKEMLDAINNVCSDDCDECIIEKPCSGCFGHFEIHEDACKEAYEIITNHNKQDNKEVTDNDIVNHPSHYTHGGMECIDEMILLFGKDVVMDFCLCNAWKYRKRAMYKNGEEDLRKSDWYIAKYKELSPNG